MTDIRRITNEHEALELAEWLLTPGPRPSPVIVMSTPPGETEPYGDAVLVQEAVGDQAEVMILYTGDASWALTNLMPARTEVYGGASRVYPVELDWLTNPYLSKVRYAFSLNDRERVSRQLIEDVLGQPAPRSTRVDPRDRRIADLEEELRGLKERLRAVDEARQVATKKAKSAARRAGPEPSFEGLFLDPDEQFRFEVYLEWAQRIPAGEKAARPLASYTIGPEFLTSVDEQEKGVPRAKVVSVIVEVLTGLAAQLPSRDLHPLRVGEQGAHSTLIREDGAVCWIAALQTKTPAARRLLYWRLGDKVELARVVRHGDYRP